MASIRRALDSTGVAVLNDCDLEQLEVLARSYGEVRSPWKKLVPQDARTADSWSLSGMFGLGAFPWHTDGAVSPRSPSVVLLYCLLAAPAVEPTHLLSLESPDSYRLVNALAPIVLEAKDRGGRVRYFPALQRTGRLFARWDSRTCRTIPWSKGVAAQELLDHAAPTSVVYWTTGKAVFIDNRTTLHRRPSVKKLGSRELARLYIYQELC